MLVTVTHGLDRRQWAREATLGGKRMPTRISSEDADRRYGITSEHEMMDNGDIRFRLKKVDGTAYIRTEAPTERPSGENGWQEAHYHSKVRETYIVQSGWMGYAECIGSAPRYYVYNAGELFTTRAHVIHNVYLPVGSVIHTVKHGEASGEARLVDRMTASFTDLTRKVSEEELRALALPLPSGVQIAHALGDLDTCYNIPYRHFDNLIWQVPAWSTAIFAVIFAGMARLVEGGPLLKFVGVPTDMFFAVSYLMFGLFILVLSYALYRFRWHQIMNKTYTPSNHLVSPQCGLQAMINAQAFILLLLSSKGFGIRPSFALGVLLVLYLLLTVAEERDLIHEGGGKPISTKS